MSEPERIPAPPSPAIALPTMNETEVGATPQIREPTSKIRREIRKTHLILKKV